MKRNPAQRAFLLALVAAATLAFLYMIRSFLVPLLLAATFAGMARPFHARLERLLGGRPAPAAALTLLTALLLVILPLLTFALMLAGQAVMVASAAGPWLERVFAERAELLAHLQALPGYELARPYWSEILGRAGALGAELGSFVLSRLSSATFVTVGFLVDGAIILYATYFFLIDGEAVLRRILYLAPLPHEDELRLLKRFQSMARATIKGTLLIGFVQGLGTGLALAVAGVPSALFWGALAAIASLIPTVGAALVWGPAALYLLITGSTLKGVLLAAWGAVVVGSADNLLRPVLVGKDTQVHELLILLSTLGGLMMFGLGGLMLGPLLAVTFLTVWDIYGAAFKEYLPEVGRL